MKYKRKRTKPNKFTLKKKAMIEALKSQLGIVTIACKQVGIGRTTHYEWLEKDRYYRKSVEEIPDMVLDFAENALFSQIKAKNVPSTIFYLKTKGKHRGYIEKTEQAIEHQGEGFKLIIEAPQKPKEKEDELE